MPLRLKELNAAKLAEWLQHESNERPSVAAHAYRLLRAFYLGLNKAHGLGWRTRTYACPMK